MINNRVTKRKRPAAVPLRPEEQDRERGWRSRRASTEPPFDYRGMNTREALDSGVPTARLVRVRKALEAQLAHTPEHDEKTTTRLQNVISDLTVTITELDDYYGG